MIDKIALYPKHVARLISIRDKIYDVVSEMDCKAALSKEPIKKSELKNAKFVEFRKRELWAKQFDCAWFKFTGKVSEKAKGKHVVAIINIQGEGSVYVDNEVQQGITQVLTGVDMFQSTSGKQIVDLFNCSNGDESVELLVDAGYNHKGVARLIRKDIAICNDDIFTYYYDYLQLLCMVLTFGKNELLTKERRDEILKNLDLSYKSASKKDFKKAHEILVKVITTPVDYKATEYSAIGHAHIDLAWLWPIRETKRKGVRTFSTAIHNMEKYPNYRFGASQAQLFQWVKEEEPELFEKVKKAVKDEKMELQGGMWCENDCNIPSGESIIRQFLYGEKFFLDEFGKTCKVVWLPDVFGYPASLPQIIKKCGREYFMTIKLTWNTHNTFPYKTFLWKGIDGTEVLSHMAPQGDYNSTGSPLAMVTANKRNPQKDTIDKGLVIFGVGDGGGGPGEAQIAFVDRQLNNKGGNKIIQRFAVDFFEDLEATCSKAVPTYNGELYLEKHQGTYTSQAKNKMHNRLIENKLHDLEWICAEAELNRITYDQDKIDEIWKEVLLYQFHDIIPGSSINRVYVESVARYEAMEKEIDEMRDDILGKLSTKQVVSVINTIDFDRHEYVKCDDKWYEVDVEKYSSSSLSKLPEITDLKYGDDYISNSKLKVVFNQEGTITSLYDKENDKEVCKDYMNKLIIYSDPKMHYNAWDINENYLNMKKEKFVLLESNSYIDGPEVVRENFFKHNDSSLVQKIHLNAQDNVVYFSTIVDWNESYKMLRTEFNPTVFSDIVNCDIQFGNVDRSTKNETPQEKAQFEICAHKFVNVDEKDYGVAVMNNCKYGYRVKEGVISLNLLRSPKYPDPKCDIGKHYFDYAIYPHSGTWQESEVVKKAYCLNNPLLVSDYFVNLERIVDVDNPNIIVETIKVSADKKGIVIRLYERYGEECEAKVKVGFKFKGSYESNMIEREMVKLDSSILKFNKYEIKTLYFELFE